MIPFFVITPPHPQLTHLSRSFHHRSRPPIPDALLRLPPRPDITF